MKLYTETLGAGPDLVLLHGWGLHAGVWESTAAELAKSWRVTLVDLPGHGRSPTPDAMLDLDAVSLLASHPVKTSIVFNESEIILSEDIGLGALY